MKNIKSADGMYEVEIVAFNEKFIATAVFCDGLTYGGNSYWFTVGIYKTVQNAIKQSVKKMAEHNIVLEN